MTKIEKILLLFVIVFLSLNVYKSQYKKIKIIQFTKCDQATHEFNLDEEIMLHYAAEIKNEIMPTNFYLEVSSDNTWRWVESYAQDKFYNSAREHLTKSGAIKAAWKYYYFKCNYYDLYINKEKNKIWEKH